MTEIASNLERTSVLFLEKKSSIETEKGCILSQPTHAQRLLVSLSIDEI